MLGFALTASLLMAPAPTEPLPPPPRGNAILQGQRSNPKWGVGATLRIPVLVGASRPLATPPVGFGFGLQLRLHPWRVGRAHLGFGVFAGHLRVPTTLRVTDASDPDAGTIPRQQLIAHTDFAAGASMHVAAGPLVLGFDVGAGVAISTFNRPVDVSPLLDERVEGVDPLVRGGLLLFIPVRDDHGPFVHVSALHVFAPERVAAADETLVPPFATVLDAAIGYMAYF